MWNIHYDSRRRESSKFEKTEIFGGVKRAEGKWGRRTNNELRSVHGRPKNNEKNPSTKIQMVGRIVLQTGNNGNK